MTTCSAIYYRTMLTPTLFNAQLTWNSRIPSQYATKHTFSPIQCCVFQLISSAVMQWNICIIFSCRSIKDNWKPKLRIRLQSRPTTISASRLIHLSLSSFCLSQYPSEFKKMIQCPILVGIRGWWNRFCSYSAVQQTTLSHYLRSSKIDMGGELSIHAGAEVLKINLVHQKHGLPIIWQYWFAGACTIWVYLCQNTGPFSLPLAKCSFAWWYNFIFLYTVCHCCSESTST